MNADIQENERQRQVTATQPTLLVCLLLLGVWLFAHPWGGIWHDAQLYAFQALSHLHPDAYRNDLFFFSDSQENYTFFSPIYAALISLLGLNAATILLLIAGYALWMGSAAWLLRNLLQGFTFWLGLILIFAMPRDYGEIVGQFRYAEPFLTPRLISEGLTLLSLAMMLSGKRLASLAAMAAAFAMHPLMALAGTGFAGFYMAIGRPKAALSASVLALVLISGLAFSGIAPFDRLLVTMDSQWFELVSARAPYVLWDEWKHEDWMSRALLSFSLLATAAITAHGLHRRAFLSPLVIGCASLLLTWMGTSLFHNVLVIQIQPWRSLWLVHFFAYIAAAWLVAQFWNRNLIYRFLLLCFLASSLTIGIAGGLLALLTASLFVWRTQTKKEIHLSKTTIALLYLIPFLAVVLRIVTSWLVAAAELTRASSTFDYYVDFMLVWIRNLLENSGSGVIAVVIFLAAWRFLPDQRKLVHLGAVSGIFFLLFLSIAIWYRPNEQDRYYDQWASHDSIPSFNRHIPVNAVAYWENNAKMTWFELGRANYASILQTAGVVFSRKTAIEGKRRMERLTALGMEDSVFDWRGNASRLPRANFKGLIHVCHDPVLDYVILSKDFGAGVIERHFEKMTGKYFYLYDCSLLRRSFADTWPDRVNEKKGPQR